jgi:pyruvate dehydrogenase kinase 2/3/4
MEFVGEVFIRCNAREVVQRCWDATQALARGAYGPEVVLPELKIEGHLDSTFPYITSHLEYIISELLRNSMQAVVECKIEASRQKVPPIEVTICESAQQVIIRIFLSHEFMLNIGPDR